jgi:hypothetical protein
MTTWGAADVEKRLNDGAWLKPGEVATLFGKSRWAVINWIKTGVKIGDERYRIEARPTTGGHRELNPAHVKAALDALRTAQGGVAEPPASES